MNKSRLSRAFKRCKQQIKKRAARHAAALFRSQSFPLLGIAYSQINLDKKKTQVTPSSHVEIALPFGIHDSLFWKFKLPYSAPEMGILKIPHATALKKGQVLDRKARVITTYLELVDGKAPLEDELFSMSFSRFSPTIKSVTTPVFSLAAGWQDAFYHWLYEVLPRLYLFEKMHVPNAHYYIAQNTSFQRESVALLGLKNVVPTHTCDALRSPLVIVAPSPGPLSAHTVPFLREKFLPHLTRYKEKKRLYISRSDATRRRISNENELTQLLERYGFEKVVMTPYNFREQMELFYNAEMIVAPHGAALSHLAFCDPGTALLEIFSPLYVHPCYWQLSYKAGINYFYLFGEGVFPPDYVDVHQDPDILVDISKVEASLKTMIASTDVKV